MNDLDDDMIDRLRRIAAEADPPPELVGLGARAALATRRIDAELAELILDSAATPATVRAGSDDTRVLSFELPAVSIELQLTGRTGRGLVAPAATEVLVEGEAGERAAVAEPGGWFTIDPIPTGTFRLRIRVGGVGTILTSWVSPG
jgi:hypothetical protein